METSASSGSGEASEKAGEFDPPRSNPEMELPQVLLPSRSDLASSLRMIKQQDENTSRLWSYDCTPVQQASEFVVCEDSKGANSASGGSFESRYAITTQTYQRFNPAPAPSRAQRSLPIISSGAAGLAARLAAADIPDYEKKTGIVMMLPWAGSDLRGDRPNHLYIPVGNYAPLLQPLRDTLAKVPGLEDAPPPAGEEPTG
ncbi:MAG: hypothetical protein ACO2ZE_12310, partial [Pseudohongiellaceae bacterium]